MKDPNRRSPLCPPPPPGSSQVIPGHPRLAWTSEVLWHRHSCLCIPPVGILRSPDHVRSPDHPIFCSPLPASLNQRPTPHSTFVENKSQSAIRLDSHRTVEALFLCFSAVKSGPISALFFRFCCPVGRGSQAFSSTKYQVLTTDSLVVVQFEQH